MSTHVGYVLVDKAKDYAKYWPHVFFKHTDAEVLRQADAAHPGHAPHAWMDVHLHPPKADAPPSLG